MLHTYPCGVDLVHFNILRVLRKLAGKKSNSVPSGIFQMSLTVEDYEYPTEHAFVSRTPFVISCMHALCGVGLASHKALPPQHMLTCSWRPRWEISSGSGLPQLCAPVPASALPAQHRGPPCPAPAPTCAAPAPTSQTAPHPSHPCPRVGIGPIYSLGHQKALPLRTFSICPSQEKSLLYSCF